MIRLRISTGTGVPVKRVQSKASYGIYESLRKESPVFPPPLSIIKNYHVELRLRTHSPLRRLQHPNNPRAHGGAGTNAGGDSSSLFEGGICTSRCGTREGRIDGRREILVIIRMSAQVSGWRLVDAMVRPSKVIRLETGIFGQPNGRFLRPYNDWRAH